MLASLLRVLRLFHTGRHVEAQASNVDVGVSLGVIVSHGSFYTRCGISLDKEAVKTYWSDER